MEKPKDRRVRKTKRALRNSFAELMAEKSIQQITVQELVDRADLSRGAFYLYYQDIYDLQEKIVDEVFAEMLLECNEYGRLHELDKPYPYLVAMLNYITSNAKVCKMLFSQNGGQVFFDRLIQTEQEVVSKEWILPLQAEYDAVLLSHYSRFVIYGFASVVTHWIENNMPETPEELADILGHIMDFGLDAIRKLPPSK